MSAANTQTASTQAAKAEILDRIRNATHLAPPSPVEIPRDYRTGRTLPTDELLDLLEDRLLDYKAEVVRASVADTAATIVKVLQQRGARTISIPAGLDRSWLEGFEGTIQIDSPDIPAPSLGDLDAVVTESAVTCAETGTIFLDGSSDQGRRALTLVPDCHICVVDASRTVVGVPEAVERLVPERPTTLISGPSATSDIELNRVEGVHGPRTLIVILRADA